MSVLLGIAVLSLGTPVQQPDTSISVLRVYEAVLTDVSTRPGSRRGVRVVISDRIAKGLCAPHCRDTASVVMSLPTDIRTQLRESGLIGAACREPDSTIGCPEYQHRTFVRLGVPYQVPSGLRVRPGEGIPPAILIKGEDEEQGVEVHVGIDVLVYWPCSPDRSPCEYLDIIVFRYFLRREADRSYHVVSRMITGAV
jgi:hypothetical protein